MATVTTPVCIALEGCYDDSMGAYDVAYLWDGVEVLEEGNMYNHTDYTCVNATLEEKRAASIWIEANTEETGNYNKYSRCDTFVGCVVTLKRSRKAPNNVPVEVIDFIDGGYNSRFNQYDAEKVVVETSEGERFTVSYGCIDTLVKGIKKLPYWYISEKDYMLAIAKREEAEEQARKEAEQAAVKKAKDGLFKSITDNLKKLQDKGYDVISDEFKQLIGYDIINIFVKKETAIDTLESILTKLINLSNETNEGNTMNKLNLTAIKTIKSFCEGLHSEPDYRELVECISNNESDFEIDNVRFIEDGSILSVMVDEIFSDNYILGCFNASFIASNSDLNYDLVKTCQESEAFEAIGKALNDTLDQEGKEAFCEEYASADGYGHHFNHYDFGEEELTINGTLYHVFNNR